jgi:NADH:ubiquinone oxidoreductase subunit C
MDKERIKEVLSYYTVRLEEKPKRLYIDIRPYDLRDAAAAVFNGLNCRFITVTGTDTPEGGIELLYHFSDDSSGIVVSLRVLLSDREHPVIDSISSLAKAALWIEREIHELLGVDFKGHPNLKHLLLGEDWPAGNYPLRHNDHE